LNDEQKIIDKKSKKETFVKNLLWGFAIVLLLQFSSWTGFGQNWVNSTYDYLAKEDFVNAIIHDEDKQPVSDALRFVFFNSDTYRQSPILDYWTSREKLGKAIIKALDMGAKVVVVDFALDRAVPVYVTQEKQIDENSNYLLLLDQAAKLAKEKGAVIIFPFTQKETEPDSYEDKYQQFLLSHNDVFKLGSAEVLSHPSDGLVRFFTFYTSQEIKEETVPLLSISVLSAIYYWHGRNEGDLLAKEISEKLKNKKELQREITIPGPNATDEIGFYQYDLQKENISARFKFRIAPIEIIKTLGEGNDPLFGLLKPVDLFLSSQSSNDWSKGKVVLIGGAHASMGDNHITPLNNENTIPGVYLIANQLNQLLKFDFVRSPLSFKIIVIGFTVFMMAFLFTYIPASWQSLILTALIISFFSPLSVWFFTKWGFFLDIWLPTTIMAGRELIASVLKTISKILIALNRDVDGYVLHRKKTQVQNQKQRASENEKSG